MKNLFSSGESSKYTLPPFPSPYPERNLSLHCTNDGLYIVPARIQKGASATTSFRRRPKTSLLSTTEDVAHDIKLARRHSISSTNGARIAWGREGTVKAADDESIKRALKGSPEGDVAIHCYGVVGILRLFNGEQHSPSIRTAY
jgi:hypothetical protein